MFYDKYIALCKRNNISPSRAAQEIGFNKSSITNWKNNCYTPRKEILVSIAKYFNVSVDYLVGNEEQKNPATDDEIKFALWGDVADEIPDEKLQEVKNFADYIKSTYAKDNN